MIVALDVYIVRRLHILTERGVWVMMDVTAFQRAGVCLGF
jgi:hypothetical protein